MYTKQTTAETPVEKERQHSRRAPSRTSGCAVPAASLTDRDA